MQKIYFNRYWYDQMGNTIMNRHTYVLPQTSPFTLITLWDYDSWGRVQTITYPDEERVNYFYNLAGKLQAVIGNKNGQFTTYVDKIVYDEYEQRVEETNGNGVVTRYRYNPLNRRLSYLENFSQNTHFFLQENTYRYDNIGNVTYIRDMGMHGREQNFKYDELNRLISSDGRWMNGTTTLNYKNSFKYSPSGRMLNKYMDSYRLTNQLGVQHVNYNYDYNYNNDNPYAVKKIGDNIGGLTYIYEWDRKGNMIYSENNKKGSQRRLCWTEDNRLQAFMETDGLSAYYNYDASGNRNMKLVGKTATFIQNGMIYNQSVLTDQTLYASDLITINNKGYTKHYFEEGKKICSKIGGGFAHSNYNDILNNSVPWLGYSYAELSSYIKGGIEITFNECIKSEPIVAPRPLFIQIIKLIIDQNDPEPTFYYHTDHLGSSSYLTDDGGNITQTINYLPYGETWVDIQTFNMIDYNLGVYLFNGKEKDQETGYNYFGARYYDSENISWLSVDPLSDKYPNLSPYAYCANNPVNLVDPDGREMDEYKVNKKTGEITFENDTKHYDANGKEVDRLFGKGDNYIDVAKGILKSDKIKGALANTRNWPAYNKDGSLESIKGLRIDLGNNKNYAERLFEFLADNTDRIEYSLIGSKANYTITSTYQEGKDDFGSYLSKQQPNDIISHIHNHPEGGQMKPSMGDMRFSERFNTNKTSFELYRDNQYYKYNGKLSRRSMWENYK
ncbi:MAG: hypothetical protein LBM25_00095 [Bacteroidales bacterium]|jgi:RHS repeat-associated protein|nr:hypothetical protein [Bacteroidales bacterium]